MSYSLLIHCEYTDHKDMPWLWTIVSNCSNETYA